MNKKLIIYSFVIALFSFNILNNLFNNNSLFAKSKEIIKHNIPKTLETYNDDHLESISSILISRIKKEPFNLIASIIFIMAILHTFLASKFINLSDKLAKKHEKLILSKLAKKGSKSIGSGICHFLGEVEAIFGIWVIVLMLAISFYFDWNSVTNYINEYVAYVEPIFVVVIMVIASTRPILFFSEKIMKKVADSLGGTLGAWWICIMTLGPILGSFITEPASMTISAILLSKKFYSLNPSIKFKYATLALLFVNTSVGGSFTNFAAPPVLMVVDSWGWSSGFMMMNFGWKALLGIIISNLLYFYLFKFEIRKLQEKYALLQNEKNIEDKYCHIELIENRFESLDKDLLKKSVDEDINDIIELYRENLKKYVLEKYQHVDAYILEKRFDIVFDRIKNKKLKEKLPALTSIKNNIYNDEDWDNREDSVPWWMIVIHIFFLFWSVLNSHYPSLCIGGFLVFMAFTTVSKYYQNSIKLKPAILVGFFLAGLVTHGNLQGWWIAPVLSKLSEFTLMTGSIFLTSFNDNAAITYLATLVPNLADSLKYMVVAGALTGGGLTVIANAPNPAGQSILKKYFNNNVSPVYLLLAAIIPTIILATLFLLFPL